MNESEMIGLMVISMGTILGVGVVVVKPILQVVKSITELNESIKNLTGKVNIFEAANDKAHKRMWEHNEEQDNKLQDHEKRLSIIESRN